MMRSANTPETPPARFWPPVMKQLDADEHDTSYAQAPRPPDGIGNLASDQPRPFQVSAMIAAAGVPPGARRDTPELPTTTQCVAAVQDTFSRMLLPVPKPGGTDRCHLPAARI